MSMVQSGPSASEGQIGGTDDGLIFRDVLEDIVFVKWFGFPTYAHHDSPEVTTVKRRSSGHGRARATSQRISVG